MDQLLYRFLEKSLEKFPKIFLGNISGDISGCGFGTIGLGILAGNPGIVFEKMAGGISREIPKCIYAEISVRISEITWNHSLENFQWKTRRKI